jgi:hypothetical protein
MASHTKEGKDTSSRVLYSFEYGNRGIESITFGVPDSNAQDNVTEFDRKA